MRLTRNPRHRPVCRDDRLHVALVAVALVGWTLNACRPEPAAPDREELDTSCSASCPDAAPDTADAAPDGPRIRVATFNVERLFDTECDTGRCQGDDAWEDQPSEFRYEREIERVAEAVRRLDAEIVLLQEIEKESVLADIRSKVPHGAMAFGETGFAASIDVGILARGELLSSRGYRADRPLERPDGSTTRFAREFLRADLEIEGRRVIAFTSHFTSQVGEDDPGRRLAEAREAADIIDETANSNPDTPVVLGGDLNDFPDSEPLRELTESGLKLAGRQRSMRERWTFCFQGETRAIDHVLGRPDTGADYIPETAHAVGDRSCPGQTQFAGSDHAAFVADFRL